MMGGCTLSFYCTEITNKSVIVYLVHSAARNFNNKVEELLNLQPSLFKGNYDRQEIARCRTILKNLLETYLPDTPELAIFHVDFLEQHERLSSFKITPGVEHILKNHHPLIRPFIIFNAYKLWALAGGLCSGVITGNLNAKLIERIFAKWLTDHPKAHKVLYPLCIGMWASMGAFAGAYCAKYYDNILAASHQTFVNSILL